MLLSWCKDIARAGLLILCPLVILPLITSHALSCSPKKFHEDIVTKINQHGTLTLSKGKELQLADLLLPTAPHGMENALDWKPWKQTLGFLKSRLIGQNILLVYTKYPKDRYNRYVAHVYLKKNGKYEWLQKLLVKEGLARVYSHKSASICLSELLSYESKARQQNKGLWENPFYKLYRSSKTFDLLRKANRFVIVTGRPRRVSEKSGHLYLNFGSNWKTDFTVKISRKYWKKMKKNGSSQRIFKKQYLRVRGWLQLNNGPILYISNPMQIETISLPDNKKTPRE